MTDIQDLAGLGRIAEKFMDVLREGIGAAALPWQTRRNAAAKADEFRTVAKAMNEIKDLVSFAQYEDGKVLIKSIDEQQPPILVDSSIEERTISRIAYQEINKQKNIEAIAQIAAESLKDEQTVSPEKPDSDWTARFFSHAGYVTTEHMQELWGKILAGEIKQPGSFSLRTLDVLKNLSKHEADIFVKVGKLGIKGDGTSPFIPNPDNGDYIRNKFNIMFGELLILQEINLLTLDEVIYKIPAAEDETHDLYIYANKLISIYRPPGTPENSIEIVVFTQVGIELLKLIEFSEADMNYLKWAISGLRQTGTSTTVATIPPNLDLIDDEQAIKLMKNGSELLE